MKYVILADSKNTQPFKIPRQLLEFNGEKLVQRTARLLKQNGVKDILITSHDKRFDNLGATRYEPLNNDYDPLTSQGYWLNAFPQELLNEPICFLFGDVYYSETAVKKIVETKTNGALFFCTYNNQCEKYIKHHDEPLAYKVVDYDNFKAHIDNVKQLKDNGTCCREPIVWELYRNINSQNINEHVMTKNYVAINDESCDIDTIDDIKKLKIKLGEIEMIKVEVIKEFTLEKFDELENIKRKGNDIQGKLFVGDTFECDKDMCDYLMGQNRSNSVVVKVIEVIPEKVVEAKEEPKIEIKEENIKSKKTTKKKSSKK